jgi:hypothetical protein
MYALTNAPECQTSSPWMLPEEPEREEMCRVGMQLYA